jgi:hypothetical protein
MNTCVRALTFVLVVSAVATVARPVAERAWFLYTLAMEEPPAALPNPLASRRRPQFVDSGGTLVTADADIKASTSSRPRTHRC